MKKRMWMVRAGEGAQFINEFKENNVVAIGWKECGDLTNVNSQAEIKELVRKCYGEQKEGTIAISAGQVYRFRSVFKQEDLVITYNSQERKYLVGEITSDYQYDLADYKSALWYPATRSAGHYGSCP